MLLLAAFVLRLLFYSNTVAFNLQNIYKGIFSTYCKFIILENVNYFYDNDLSKVKK